MSAPWWIYRSIVLPVVLYGVCILVSHIAGRECRLWDFDNREEVTGGWSKLHNEELHDLCCSSNIIRVFRLKRRVGYMG